MNEIEVFVALGSNLGDSSRLLLEAMDALEVLSVQPLRRSSLWGSAPVDCPPGSPSFVNAVVGMRLTGDWRSEHFLARLQELECSFGRLPKCSMNEARRLDLDLLAFGDEVRASATLTLPHPRAHERAFVLVPWAEIAPDWMVAGIGERVQTLLKRLPEDQRVPPWVYPL